MYENKEELIESWYIMKKIVKISLLLLLLFYYYYYIACFTKGHIESIKSVVNGC